MSNQNENQAISKMRNSLHNIEAINEKLNLLSLNALIQAADAGDAGRAFAVVAQQMQELSTKTAESSATMSKDIEDTAEELARTELQAKGTRFSDLAHNTIELIDRNLYERTADARWWATDSDLVTACMKSDDSALTSKASERIGVILRNYTVYCDIVLVDTDGKIISNGGGRFNNLGEDVGNEEWFIEAMQTRNGTEYHVQDVHSSPFIDNNLTVAYSTAVREGGETSGKVVGALCVFFDWDQAVSIVKNVSFDRRDRARTRTVYFSNKGQVIAANDDIGVLTEDISELGCIQTALQGKKGFTEEELDGEPYLVAYASTPGYETYEGLGWGCAIFYSIND